MPDVPAVDSSNAVFQSIPIDQIKPSRHQARKVFDEESIKSLAESIRLEGLQQPVTVRPVEGGFELIAGERRWRAVKLLSLSTILAHVVDVPNEAAAAAKGLVENLQRQDLNPIEEAEGFKELSALDSTYWTQEQIGKVAGKPQSRISESIRLLSLPDQIKDNIRQRILSREHGIELLRLNNANSSKSMANKAIKGGWSVKKLRDAIDKKQGKVTSVPAKHPGGPPDPFAEVWKPLLSNTSINACSYWTVEFTKDDWCFKASRTKFAEPKDFADWFRQLADALAKAG